MDGPLSLRYLQMSWWVQISLFGSCICFCAFHSICVPPFYVCLRACLSVSACVCVVCILIIIKKEVEDENDGATKVLRNECFCLCVCVYLRKGNVQPVKWRFREKKILVVVQMKAKECHRGQWCTVAVMIADVISSEVVLCTLHSAHPHRRNIFSTIASFCCLLLSLAHSPITYLLLLQCLSA